MSDTFLIKRGDTSPSLRYALEPTSVVLTGVTVRGHLRARGASTPVVDRAATVVTPTGTPTVQLDWEAGDTDIAGLYEAEFEVTYSDGKIETFPNAGFIPVKISEDVA